MALPAGKKVLKLSYLFYW